MCHALVGASQKLMCRSLVRQLLVRYTASVTLYVHRPSGVARSAMPPALAEREWLVLTPGKGIHQTTCVQHQPRAAVAVADRLYSASAEVHGLLRVAIVHA